MQRNSKRHVNFMQMKQCSIVTGTFLCLQMVQESVSLFMFLLQVKEKEEAVDSLE
jgi:hypothetical protein